MRDIEIERDEGQTMVEYSLVLLGVCVAAAGAFVLVSDEVLRLIDNVVGFFS